MPRLMHAVYTPSITRVWMYTVDEALMEEFLQTAYDMFLNPNVILNKIGCYCALDNHN